MIRSHPRARRPDRSRRVDNGGIELQVSEWGAIDDPPMLLAHGGFDFGGTYDVFAPILAEGGWRVVCWDQRGHGDSDHSDLYQWDADIRDGLRVLDSVTREPVPFVGHSKGGSLMVHLADAMPHRASAVVNLDGVPGKRMPDIQDRDRTKLLAAEIAGWLDHRRRIDGLERKPGTIQELAARRARMNPRLTPEWLEYLVTVGAREDDDGWRWKIDPALRFGGFGPWRPEWSMQKLANIGVPMLILLGLEPEEMGWGTTDADLDGLLPPDAEVECLDGLGHFVHIEDPDGVAARILGFLDRHRLRERVVRPVEPAKPSSASPEPDPAAAAAPVGSAPPSQDPAVTMLRHARIDLALWTLRDGPAGHRPLLLLHGLGEHTPAAVPAALEAWPGPVYGLDFTGHGASSVPRGGGYYCEVLMGDVDRALAHLGEATLVGRGLGGYVALLAAGGRPELVRGAVITDGPGIHGGGVAPGTTVVLRPEPGAPGETPDPFALVELARDVRPPDYARSFAWQASALSGLDTCVAVAAFNRPEWLAEVAAQPGVVEASLPAALDLFVER